MMACGTLTGRRFQAGRLTWYVGQRVFVQWDTLHSSSTFLMRGKRAVCRCGIDRVCRSLLGLEWMRRRNCRQWGGKGSDWRHPSLRNVETPIDWRSGKQALSTSSTEETGRGGARFDEPNVPSRLERCSDGYVGRAWTSDCDEQQGCRCSSKDPKA